jgi:hypothetical protein
MVSCVVVCVVVHFSLDLTARAIVLQAFLLAPHTSGPRDVPRCGALSLLQKTPHYRGDPAKTAARLNVKLRDLTACLPGISLLILHGI